MGKLCAILLTLLTGLLAADLRGDSPATAPTGNSAAIITLRGTIDDYNRDALIRRFESVKERGVGTVILEIDTYGGLVTAGLDISRYLKQQDIHTIAFVKNKAISAGAMIALACDEIVMEPGSQIGDCAPIVYSQDGTLQTLGTAERAKAESPILADFRDSARRNGYDPALIETMVKTNEKGELLTVHADQALQLKLAKAIAPSATALAADRGLNVVFALEPGIGEDAVQILNSGVARMLLITIFLMSLKIAISAPGHGAPEAISVIALGLIVGVPLLAGYAQWWEIMLIFAGLALVAFEVFVFPGHGVTGIVGALMVVVGLILTFVPKEPTGIPGFLPQLGITWDALQTGLIYTAGGLLSSLALWLWLQRYLPKIPYFNKLVLQTSVGSTVQTTLPMLQDWLQPGTAGKAVTELKPGGTVAFTDPATGLQQAVSVISDSGFVDPESDVVVERVQGNYVVVKKA